MKGNLKKIGYNDTDWINPAQDRDKSLAVVNTAMNIRVP